MSGGTPNLRMELQGPVAVLTIDRADKRNALTPEMLGGMVRRAAEAGNSAGALVLEGAGGVFCSGFDLSLCLKAPDGSVMRELLSKLSELVRTLRGLPIPVVVAAHGAALAGGCAILGGADVVVCDAGAKLGYPVVRIGVSPAVSAPFLTGMVQPGPARARLLDPGLIGGTEAVRLGLAHECVERPDQVGPRAMELAQALAAKPRRAMRETKAWLMELDGWSGMAGAALAASLALTGGAEERELLPRALAGAARKPE